MRKKGSTAQLHKKRALGVGALKNHFWEKATIPRVEAISTNKRKAGLSRGGIGLACSVGEPEGS